MGTEHRSDSDLEVPPFMRATACDKIDAGSQDLNAKLGAKRCQELPG